MQSSYINNYSNTSVQCAPQTPRISQNYYDFLDIKPQSVIRYLDQQRKKQFEANQQVYDEMDQLFVPLPPPLHYEPKEEQLQWFADDTDNDTDNNSVIHSTDTKSESVIHSEFTEESGDTFVLI